MDHLHLSELLSRLDGQYAFYCHPVGKPPFFQANTERFSAASLIKIPVLLAWAALERAGLVDLEEICNLDSEPQVKGAGFARWMHSRRLPYHDVLLMMIATSDNVCSNLAIQRVGFERLNAIFHEQFGLNGCLLQRNMMDFEARQRGLDNWISAQDCIRMLEIIHALPEAQRAWVEPMLLSCQDSSLFFRNVERDTVHFFHKTGSIPGVLHDWGYTRRCDLFLLTQACSDELEVNQVFGLLGQHLLTA